MWKAKGRWKNQRIRDEAYRAACDELFAYVPDSKLEIEEVPGLTCSSVYRRIDHLGEKHSLDPSDALQLFT
jgi:hypothetical protein